MLEIQGCLRHTFASKHDISNHYDEVITAKHVKSVGMCRLIEMYLRGTTHLMLFTP